MKLLSEHPGEHNARRYAKIRQAERLGDIPAVFEATYDYPILRADGTKTSVDGRLDYPAKAEVTAIHHSLALAYSVQNKKIMPYAMDATAWDAFCVYDAGMSVAA
jgi:hypothetical protein